MYPEVAQVECRLCKIYSFNLLTGNVNTYEDEHGKKLPVLRLGTPTPCESCPKKSPENERKLKLTKRNEQAWDFYCRFLALPNAFNPQFMCPVTQRNFGIMKNTVELAKARVAEKLASSNKQGEQDE